MCLRAVFLEEDVSLRCILSTIICSVAPWLRREDRLVPEMRAAEVEAEVDLVEAVPLEIDRLRLRLSYLPTEMG